MIEIYENGQRVQAIEATPKAKRPCDRARVRRSVPATIRQAAEVVMFGGGGGGGSGRVKNDSYGRTVVVLGG